MKYILKFLMAGVLLWIVNGFIWLWHFDCQHFITEKDVSDWSENMKNYDPPIDF